MAFSLADGWPSLQAKHPHSAVITHIVDSDLIAGAEAACDFQRALPLHPPTHLRPHEVAATEDEDVFDGAVAEGAAADA
jgi:hypothetical protein